MAKKKSAVVFTPLIDTAGYKLPDVNTSVNPQIPAYEDKGVRYQGKYKVQTGNNSYELRGQIPFQIQLGEKHSGGVGPMSTLSADIPTGKQFVITSISIQYKSSNGTGWFVIYSAGATTGISDDRTIYGVYHGSDGLVHEHIYCPIQPLPFAAIRRLVIDAYDTNYQTNLAGAYAQTNFNDDDFFYIILNGFLEEI